MTLRFAEHVGANLVCFDSAERQGMMANAVRVSLEAGIRSARAAIETGVAHSGSWRVG